MGANEHRAPSRAGRYVPQFLPNLAKNPIEVSHHVIVPESEYPEALLTQKIVPLLIVYLPLLRVLATVKFNNQLMGQADKVNNIGLYRMLSTELFPCQPPLAKLPPQHRFDSGLLTTKPSRTFMNGVDLRL